VTSAVVTSAVVPSAVVTIAVVTSAVVIRPFDRHSKFFHDAAEQNLSGVAFPAIHKLFAVGIALL
jgi:hypothetical protein